MNRRKKAENPENMSLVGHLQEIRNRIAVSIAAFVVAFIACFAVIKPLADALLHMGIEYGFAYVYLAPSELLTAYVKLSLVVALVIVSPVLLSQLWGFVAPALTSVEKRAVRPALVGGLCFFFLGALFCYRIALPFMIRFLVEFSASAYIHSSISVASYLDFMIGMLLTFGLVFEEPMLAYVLTKIGILTPSFLRRVRRYAIPVIFIIAAVITPPDVVSQFMVAVPMIGLYELSIVISVAVSRGRERREALEDCEDMQDTKARSCG